MECSCCGGEFEADRVASLKCHSEIAICRGCIDWLRRRAGGVDVTTTLPVADMDAAVAFHEAAGFEVHRHDDGFAFVSLDGQSVFDLGLEPIDPTTNRAACFLTVKDVDGWHERLTAAGLPATEPADQPYGMREFTLTDPSGNRLHFGQPI